MAEMRMANNQKVMGSASWAMDPPVGASIGRIRCNRHVNTGSCAMCHIAPPGRTDHSPATGLQYEVGMTRSTLAMAGGLGKPLRAGDLSSKRRSAVRRL